MFVLSLFEFLVQHRAGALALLEAFAMPFGGGLGHLGLLPLQGLGLLVDALLGRCQRLIELLLLALLMPVGADKLPASRFAPGTPGATHSPPTCP